VEFLAAKGEWSKVNEAAKMYFDKKTNNFTAYTGAVGLLLAQSYEKTGSINDALAAYAQLYTGGQMGLISVSAPAVKRWMELMWERNTPSVGDKVGDQQGAYNGGQQYIEFTRRIYDKMSQEEKELWSSIEQQVKEYEARPGIKSAAQQKKEAAEK
jgi:hypothetical protein